MGSKCITEPAKVMSKAPGDLKIGDYVFATRWSDADYSDPNVVGFVIGFKDMFIQVGNTDGSLIDGVGRRLWPYFKKITREQGHRIINEFQALEGSPYDQSLIIEILGIDKPE